MTTEFRDPQLVVLFEHPTWPTPLFHALDRRRVAYRSFDLKSAAFGTEDPPRAPLYFNQASPSAYVRGNARAVPLALALIEQLESRGARVLNGSHAFRIELSKLAQISLMRDLGVCHPRTLAFNDVEALAPRADEIGFPAILKPDQGGSGARMFRVESVDEIARLLERQPELWLPDNLLLLQEYLPQEPAHEGIVRLEFLGGELLYAMRIVSHGVFNLCPSESCNPLAPENRAPRFSAFPDVPSEAVAAGRLLFAAAGLDIGSIEYLETSDGRRVFYDVNANSNLRPSIAWEFGFDPYERVVDFLVGAISKAADGSSADRGGLSLAGAQAARQAGGEQGLPYSQPCP